MLHPFLKRTVALGLTAFLIIGLAGCEEEVFTDESGVLLAGEKRKSEDLSSRNYRLDVQCKFIDYKKGTEDLAYGSFFIEVNQDFTAYFYSFIYDHEEFGFVKNEHYLPYYLRSVQILPGQTSTIRENSIDDKVYPLATNNLDIIINSDRTVTMEFRRYNEFNKELNSCECAGQLISE